MQDCIRVRRQTIQNWDGEIEEKKNRLCDLEKSCVRLESDDERCYQHKLSDFFKLKAQFDVLHEHLLGVHKAQCDEDNFDRKHLDPTGKLMVTEKQIELLEK